MAKTSLSRRARPFRFFSSSACGADGSPKFCEIGLGEIDGRIASVEPVNTLDPEGELSLEVSGMGTAFASLCWFVCLFRAFSNVAIRASSSWTVGSWPWDGTTGGR